MLFLLFSFPAGPLSAPLGPSISRRTLQRLRQGQHTFLCGHTRRWPLPIIRVSKCPSLLVYTPLFAAPPHG